MGELFPFVLMLIALLIIGVTMLWKTSRVKTIEEQDTVIRFKVSFSHEKAKEVALKMQEGAEKNSANFIEFYEEGTNRLIRFEIK